MQKDQNLNQNQPVVNASTQSVNSGFQNESGNLQTPSGKWVLEPAVSSAGGLHGFYHSNRLYIWAAFLGLVIIALLVFLAFRKPSAPQAQEAKVAITIDAPNSVASGGEGVYAINLLNQDTAKLTNVQLEIVYPEGITFLDSQPVKPVNLSKTEFNLEDLTPNIKVPLFLKTKIVGGVGDVKNLSVKLHYKYNNFNSEYIKEASYSVSVAASNMTLDLDGPATANNGQLVVLNINYQNNSDSDVQNVRIKLSYPDGFVFASSDPQPDISTDTWNVGTLAKGGSGKISIQGSYNLSSPGESKPTKAELLILGPNGQYFAQNTANLVTAISSQPLLVTQSLSSERPDGVVNPGETLSYVLKFQNNASVAARAVNIVVTLDSKALDFSSIQAEGAQVNNDTIIWNASSDSRLQVLAPNEGGNLHFSVRIKDPATKDSSKNLVVDSHVKIKSAEYDTYFPGNEYSLKISSPSSISGAVSYVSGQMPPKVGQETIYKITLALRNSTNDFSNTTVSMFLPQGVVGFDPSSVNSAEAGNVVYDTTTSNLIWKVGLLPAHTGKFSAARSLNFNLKLNPSSSQVYQSPLLVKTISMEATDIFTGMAVQKTADDLFTSSLSGSYGGGESVQP